VEIARFMEKPFALATASRQHFERLLKIGAKLSESGASTASLFSDVINLLTKAVMRMAGSSRGIRELSLARITFLPPFDLWSKRVPSPEEEYLPTEMGRTNVSFLLNVTVARKIAAELARRIAVKTPEPALLPEYTPHEAEPMEKLVEEPTRTVPHIVADVQKRFESELAPSMRGIGMGFEEHGRKAILSAPPEEAPKVGFPEEPLARSSFEYVARLPSAHLNTWLDCQASF